MINIIYLWGFMLAALPQSGVTPQETPACLSVADATRILGQPAVQTESATRPPEGGAERFICTYTATMADAKTHKTGHVYYMYEVYRDEALAEGTYQNIVSSNARMPGQRRLDNLGNEAWEHSDGEGFYLIMVRKQNRMIRIKINSLTSKTSLENLKAVVQRVVTTM
jgi:hypothetical protein